MRVYTRSGDLTSHAICCCMVIISEITYVSLVDTVETGMWALWGTTNDYGMFAPGMTQFWWYMRTNQCYDRTLTSTTQPYPALSVDTPAYICGRPYLYSSIFLISYYTLI